MIEAHEVLFYTCGQCRDRCRSTRSTIELIRERMERLPHLADEDVMVVCHECWTANRLEDEK